MMPQLQLSSRCRLLSATRSASNSNSVAEPSPPAGLRRLLVLSGEAVHHETRGAFCGIAVELWLAVLFHLIE